MSATAVARTWIAPSALDPAARRALADLIPYCVPGVADHDVTGGLKPAVQFVATDTDHADRVERLLDDAFARVAAAGAPPTVLLDQWDQPATPAGTSPDVHQIGPGLFVSGPRLVRLMRAVDEAALDIAAAAGAVEYAVPHLAMWSTLDRTGYPANFPQHLTACTVVGPDLAALDRFSSTRDPAARAADLQATDACVAPAVCPQLFAHLASATVAAPMVLTARGACARYEAGAQASPARRWSFTMREIVYVGDADGAGQFRATMREALSDLARALGLPCRLVSANDPFFTASRPEMTRYQETFDVKYELQARLAGDGSALAVSSLNYHGEHFGAGFDIRLPDGAPVHSVCLGFGLERWGQWLCEWLGEDATRWPAPLDDR